VEAEIPVGAVAEIRLPDLPGGAWLADGDPCPARGLRAGPGRHRYRFRQVVLI
jgi:hypothetical protein